MQRLTGGFVLAAAVCLLAASASAFLVGVDLGSANIKVALVKPGMPFQIVTNTQSKRKVRVVEGCVETWQWRVLPAVCRRRRAVFPFFRCTLLHVARTRAGRSMWRWWSGGTGSALEGVGVCVGVCAL